MVWDWANMYPLKITVWPVKFFHIGSHFTQNLMIMMYLLLLEFNKMINWWDNCFLDVCHFHKVHLYRNNLKTFPQQILWIKLLFYDNIMYQIYYFPSGHIWLSKQYFLVNSCCVRPKPYLKTSVTTFIK